MRGDKEEDGDGDGDSDGGAAAAGYFILARSRRFPLRWSTLPSGGAPVDSGVERNVGTDLTSGDNAGREADIKQYPPLDYPGMFSEFEAGCLSLGRSSRRHDANPAANAA